MSDYSGPSTLHTLLEGLSGLEFAGLAAAWPRLIRQPKGDGQPVYVSPGFLADDNSTIIIRRYLDFLGYKTYGWDLGRNDGNVHRLVGEAVEQIDNIYRQSREPIALVGWSLGGVISRAIAIERPGLISQIITMGSPIQGGPKYTAFAKRYADQGIDLNRLADFVEFRESVPIHRPITAIYTKTDGIVAWQACFDRHNKQTEHIEVKTTHMGLGFNKDVLITIANKLAR